MQVDRVKVLVACTKTSLYQGYSTLEQLFTTQVEIVYLADVLKCSTLANGVKVAFYFRDDVSENIIKCKEDGLLSDLCLICSRGVGLNHIPLDRLRRLGLRLANTFGLGSEAVADLAVGLMLACGRLGKY